MFGNPIKGVIPLRKVALNSLPGAVLKREPSDAVAVSQDALAHRWTAPTIGIAEAAALKKRIPLPSGNREFSEKAGFGCRGVRLSGPGKGRLGGGTVPVEEPALRVRLEANGCVFAATGRPED